MQNKYSIFVLIFFIATGFAGILHHEIWRDEAHHWLLARDSNSLRQLWQNTMYEGHPILWNLMLFLITRVTHDPFYMQFTHLLIAIGAVYALLFHLNLTVPQKILAISSYFIFYEYTIISRNYALLVLLFFIALSILQSKSSKIILLSIVLFLLSNSHLFGLILSGCIVILAAINYKQYLSVLRRDIIIGSVIVLTGVIVSIIQIIPPLDSSFVSNINLNITFEKLTRALSTPIKGLLPIPDFFDYHFWNSHLVIRFSHPLAGIISITLLFLPLFLFRKKESLILFYTASILIMIFLSIAGLTAARYAGVLFILFISGLSIEQSGFGTALNNRLAVNKKLFNYITYSILSVQSLIGIYVYVLEIQRPFSEAKNVVRYLGSHNLKNRIILGEFCESTALSTYLQKKVFYLELKDYGSFCRWNWDETFSHAEDFLMKEAVSFAQKQQEKPLFIHYRPLLKDNEYYKNFNLIAEFTNGVVRNENFIIYEVSPEPSP